MTTGLSFSHVSKRFTVQHDRARSFQDLMLRMLQRQGRHLPRESYWAVNDLSFDIKGGETVAIVGNNGSGKSTSLKLMTRILTPTRGTVDVRGRVSGLLELGAGFHPELSGRDNVYLNGALMGLKKRDIERRFDEIVAFSELERFIDVQLKFYSSGMAMRLAFSIAVSVDADILLVDEVLAVGDPAFQVKCLHKIHEIMQEGVTIVFVSHDLDAVQSLCQRAVWLDRGRMMMDGECGEVLDAYVASAQEEDQDVQIL
ncbi:MAG: ABC transporter ATP-binding protein [Chloroflexi bacterium]|nr:ABC transporter ATP-binding protein [Chloroflexota bacterium]